MTTTKVLLSQARRGQRLTQGQLAQKARAAQSWIARSESGESDLLVSSLARLVHAAGYQLAVLPSRRETASSAAEHVRDALRHNRHEAAYRAVIQLADGLQAEDGATRVALCVAPPAETGDLRYDAFIAGVVEFRLEQDDLPKPEWLARAPRLCEPWSVDEYADEETSGATPRALRDRGVVIGEWEFDSA